jgi:hypothetical protein
MTVQAVQYVPAAQSAITAETVVAALPFTGQAIGPQADRFGLINAGTPRVIFGIVNLSIGATATAVTIRVRSGATTAGTLIGVADVSTPGASETQSFTFMAVDTSVFPAGNQYCVTVACANAVTPNDVTIMLDILSPAV